jgi:signal transduction histidine kinase
MLWTFCLPRGGAAAVPRAVLVLDQTLPGGEFFVELSSSFRSTLNESGGDPIPIYIENLDLLRFGSPRQKGLSLDYLRERYKQIPIGVIVAIGPEGYKFALQARKDLWPQSQLVFLSVEGSIPDERALPAGVTGVTYSLTPADSIAAAKMIVPDLQHLALISGQFERQTFQTRLKDELPALAPGVSLIDLVGLPLKALQERVGGLPSATAILYLGLTVDGDGVNHDPRVALGALAQVAKRPIVIDRDFYFGYGGVGGSIVNVGAAGTEAARMTARILKGETASDIAVTNVPSRLIFEWPALRRWGVSETRLPRETEIRFRSPSMWEQYRLQITAALTVLLLQTAMIIWLVIEHRRRRIAEAESRQRMTELAQLNRLGAVSELTASISHEINQPLAAMLANAGAGLRWLAGATPDLTEVRAALKRIVNDAERAGKIIGTLRVMFLKGNDERVLVDVNDLIQDVIVLIRRDLVQQRISVQVDLTDNVPRIVGNRTQLQQVILNLAINAKDAMETIFDRPRVLRVKSALDKADDVVISVEDSGTGIDAAKMARIFDRFYTTKPAGMGMGLAICRSIIESHGGQLSVMPRHPHGSVFRIVLPVGESGQLAMTSTSRPDVQVSH